MEVKKVSTAKYLIFLISLETKIITAQKRISTTIIGTTVTACDPYK
jgi:hypothetical protein